MATEGTGARAARDLGPGWKISPSVRIEPGQTFTLADITGSGAIQHIWMTPTGNWRFSILRIYWDGETTPSVEAPVGDFFASGWGQAAPISSLAGGREPGQRVQQLLDDAVPPLGADHDGEHRREADDALLPDHLRRHADWRRRGLLPRPVPPDQPAARQAGLHAPRRREGPGPVRRHGHELGRAQQRLVGRGRDQVLHGRRHRPRDDRRHRHRGLLLRVVQLREPGHAPVPGVHDAPTRACRW